MQWLTNYYESTKMLWVYDFNSRWILTLRDKIFNENKKFFNSLNFDDNIPKFLTQVK